MKGTYAELDSSVSRAQGHDYHLGENARPLELEPPHGPAVTPQKYPRIFIIILLYILGMN